MRHLLMSTAIARIIAPLAFMSDELATVIIDTPNGPTRINKADFKEGEHTLHALNGTVIPTPITSGPQPAPLPNGPPAAVEPAHNTTPAGGASAAGLQANAPVAPTTVDPITDPETIARIAAMKLTVITTGKGKNARFFLFDSVEGKPVTDVPGINSDGYATNKDAWDALYQVQPAAVPIQS